MLQWDRLGSRRMKGFCYNTRKQKYCLIKDYEGHGFCLARFCWLEPEINAFCYSCRAPQPPDWTTSSKTLDSFIMKSWSNMTWKYDAYIQWIEYSLLMNVRKMTSLRHGCTHIADWQSTRVTLKMIVDNESFDFHQVNYSRVNNAMQSIRV